MQEFQKDSYLTKLRNFAVNQLTGELWRFARGVVQLSSAVAYGPVGTAVATAVFSGLSLFRYHGVDQQTRKNLLELYSTEIASIVGKSAKDLTIKDVEKVAQYQPNGIKNAIALELEASEKNNEINLKASIVGILGVATLGIMAASVIPATLLSGAGFMIASTTFGVLSNLVFMSADHLASSMNGKRINYTFNIQLKDMVNQARFHNLPEEQVFDLLLKAHPEIDQQIRSQYSKSYIELPSAIKTEVVTNYDKILNTRLITRMINNAEMNVQELAFIAYGQNSGVKTVPRHKIETQLADMSEKESHANNISHTNRLEASRSHTITKMAVH